MIDSKLSYLLIIDESEFLYLSDFYFYNFSGDIIFWDPCLAALLFYNYNIKLTFDPFYNIVFRLLLLNPIFKHLLAAS